MKIVLGLGVSGIAAAKFLVKQGGIVTGIDERCQSGIEGVHLQSGSEPIDWTQVEELIVSPGISPEHPIYAEALKRKILITAEAELALAHLYRNNLKNRVLAASALPQNCDSHSSLGPGQWSLAPNRNSEEPPCQIPNSSGCFGIKKKLVAITGTNGKTTVTLLVEHVLNQAGIPAIALGNVGIALCDYLLSPGPEEVCVVELSSYQLERMRTAVFESAVLLNITPDHLDRYSSMEEYAKAKCHLESLVKPNGSFFVQKAAALEYNCLLKSPRLFGWDSSCDLWTDQVAIFEGETVACLLPIVYKDRGRHATENAVAAWGICRHLGVSSSAFTKGLETFQTPPHRIEWVREVNEVAYYDDSKGTNIDAVIQAVSSMKSDVVLIVGGVDKGASYLPWKEPFANKVKHLVAIGQAAEKIQRELSPYFAITRVDSLEKAVNLAADLAAIGDCVLLSPGCSSFDMFRDYAHRGEEFQKHVKNL